MWWFWDQQSNLLPRLIFPGACRQSIVDSLVTFFETDSGFYLFFFLQNILKRTTPGSRDEDTATKAFNELKKVIIIFNNHLDEVLLLVRRGGNNHAGVRLLDHQRMQLQRAVHEEDGGIDSPQQEDQFWGKSERSGALFQHLWPPPVFLRWPHPARALYLQIFPLISQSRWLVKHGELLEVDTQMMTMSGSKLKLPTKPVYLHLFNDCLLLSRRKEWVTTVADTDVPRKHAPGTVMSFCANAQQYMAWRLMWKWSILEISQ